ncbi:MAG: hypothetical protein E4H29_05685 [Deltaproteobacteria bacterium]|nr:MAG: hypothetical protein E4H29_05685 [Deltaproteobacteria bacterium]
MWLARSRGCVKPRSGLSAEPSAPSTPRSISSELPTPRHERPRGAPRRRLRARCRRGPLPPRLRPPGAPLRRRHPRYPLDYQELLMPWGKGSHKTTRDKFPTKEEMKALLHWAPRVHKDLGLAVRLAYYFGLRCGEVRILKAAHLDVEKKTLWAPTLKRVHRKSKKHPLKDPSQRTDAELPTFALSCPGTPEALKAMQEALLRTRSNPHGWVFPSFELPDAPRDISWFRRWFSRARQKAKVRKVLSFHSIRHAHGSAVAEGTKDPVFVRDRLRHTDLKTSNIYMHSTKRYEDELGSVLGGD